MIIVEIEHIAEFIAAALGLVIVGITYRAARSSSQQYLYYLSLGFAIISLGSIVEELLAQFVIDFTIRQDHLLESIFVNIGFLFIWFALRGAKDSGDDTVSLEPEMEEKSQ